jgi:polysaccharide biosynthesis protein PslH
VKLLLVAEELPARRDTGASFYLGHFVDYCAARGIDLTLLVTGHRFERLFFDSRRMFAAAKPTILGTDLVRIGPWCLVLGWRSWRHALFRWITRSGPARLRASAFKLRRTVKGGATIIGRWLEPAEARRLASSVRAIDPDVMLVNTVFASAILDVKPARTRAAVITHDVVHQRILAFQARGLKAVPVVTRSDETALLRRFDAAVAISPEDAAELRELAPDKLIVVVPPPVAPSPAVHASIRPLPVAPQTVARRPAMRRCVFLGTGSALNVDGVSWFLNSVWPIVLGEIPDARFELIGSVCNAVAGGAAGLIKRHIVEDLGPALAAVDFAVNPVLAGSGVKIKMLDYFAHGLPAVTTSIGAAGLPRNGAEPFIVCDAAEEFAGAVLDWWRRPSEEKRYRARCEGYVRLFSSRASYAEIDRALGVGSG